MHPGWAALASRYCRIIGVSWPSPSAGSPIKGAFYRLTLTSATIRCILRGADDPVAIRVGRRGIPPHLRPAARVGPEGPGAPAARGPRDGAGRRLWLGPALREDPRAAPSRAADRDGQLGEHAATGPGPPGALRRPGHL